MANAVEVEKLSKKFVVSTGGFWSRQQSSVWAVNELSLTVAFGQSIAFIGPNGAGKSTTIKMLTGILEPTSGSAQVLGLTPAKDRQKLAMEISAVFGQRSQLWYHLPATDTFDLLAKIYDLESGFYRQRRALLIDKFNLAPFLSIPVRKLSLGQRMKAELAASLLHKPRVIFLDEPTIGLDVIARMELRELIRQWNHEDGLTVFLTSHDAGDIEAVAERVVIVNHGQIVLDDSVANMRRNYLASKVLKIRFHEIIPKVDISGVSVIAQSDYAVELEIDSRIVPIQRVIDEVIRLGNVADITIEDPPLEDIIAHIYGSHSTDGSRDDKNNI